MRSYHALLCLSIFLFSHVLHASDIKLEEIPHSKQKQGTIQKVLQGSYDEVWNTIMDIENYSQFMPKNKKTTIVELDKNHIRYRALVNMPWPISDVEYECDVFQ